MAHPNGGHGNTFHTKHTFDQAYNHVGPNGVTFNSTKGKKITATQSLADDNTTKTIKFKGETDKKAYTATRAKLVGVIEVVAVNLELVSVQKL